MSQPSEKFASPSCVHSDQGEYSRDERLTLLRIAHVSIESQLADEALSLEAPTPHLAEKRGAFTTLYVRRELRGCVGYVFPVASIYRANDMSEAIEIANNSIFGLGACAWTNDAKERDLFINEIESGLAFINGMVASDPRIPFGGVKHSGYGRELSHHGILEFVNVKSVCIQEAESGKTKSRTE